jgi:class 3 adenylate cyclase/tetratricopeptide (TPR) repeat protein
MDPVKKDQSVVIEGIASEINEATTFENSPIDGDISIERNGNNGAETHEIHPTFGEVEFGIGADFQHIIESARTPESLDDDPDYARFLDEALDQDFITPELHDKGRVVLRDATILSLDVKGYSKMANEELKREQKLSYRASTAAAAKVSAKLESVTEDIREIVKSLGGQIDQFWGDGVNVIFDGDNHSDNVDRAVRAVKLLQAQMRNSGLEMRAGIDVGDVELVAYGNKSKRADMMGEAIDGADATQKMATKDNNWLALSDVAQAIWSNKNGIELNGKSNGDGPVVMDLSNLDFFGKADEDFEENGGRDKVVRKIATREAFLSDSRRKEMREEFILGRKRDKDFIGIGTLFIELGGDTNEYEVRNELMSEMFEKLENYRGKVDKVHGNVMMVNFSGFMSDHHSVRGSKEVVDWLNSQGIQFKAALARAEGMSLTVGGMATVAGEGVIRARRLLDNENSGNCLVVDKAVLDRAKKFNVKADIESPKTVAGFDEPVTSFVIKEVGVETATPQGRELIFREKELELLDAKFERAKQEKVVEVLIGEKGMGKSAVVNEFVSKHIEKDGKVVSARAEIYDQNQPYAVWRTLLDKSLGLERLEPAARNRVLQGFYQENLPEMVGEIGLLNPFFMDARYKFEMSDRIKYLDGEALNEKRAEFLAKTLDVITGANEGHPGLVVLEDLQFFDTESEKLLTGVINLSTESNMFVLTAWEKDINGVSDMPRGEFREQIKTEVEIDKISRLPILAGEYEAKRESGELKEWWQAEGKIWLDVFSSFVDFDKSDFEKNESGYMRLAAKLSQITEGNFGHAGSVLYYLTVYRGDKENHFTQDEDGKFRLGTRYIENDIFNNLPTIESIQQTRLEMLDIETRSLLKDASVSVIGDVFDSSVLSAVSGMSEKQIQVTLQTAIERGFVVNLGEGRYEFVDQSMVHAIYNSIADVEEKERKHRVLGEYYEKENPDDIALLVRHFRNSDDYVKALKYIDIYSDNLRKDSLWGPALNHVAYATKIFERMKDNGWVIPDVKKAGETRELSPKEVHELVHGQISRALKSISSLRSTSGKREQVMLWLDGMDNLFVEYHKSELSKEDRIISNQIEQEWAAYKMSRGKYEDASKHLDNAENLLEDGEKHDDASRVVIGKLYNLRAILARKLEDPTVALAHYQKGIQQVYGLEKSSVYKALLNGMANCYAYDMRDYDKAGEIYNELAKSARKTGDKGVLAVVLGNLGELEANTGKFDSSESHWREVVSLAQRISQMSSVAYAWSGLGFLHRMKGNYAEAHVMFERALNYYKVAGDRDNVPVLRAEDVVCLIRAKELEKAKNELGILQNELTESAKTDRNLRVLARINNLSASVAVTEREAVSGEDRKLANVGFQQLHEMGASARETYAFEMLSWGYNEIVFGDKRYGVELVKDAQSIYEELKNKSEDYNIAFCLALAEY